MLLLFLQVLRNVIAWMRYSLVTRTNATEICRGAVSVQRLYTLYSNKHRPYDINFSQIACTVKKLGHRSAKNALIKITCYFHPAFADEINGKYSEESVFSFGTSHGTGLGSV